MYSSPKYRQTLKKGNTRKVLKASGVHILNSKQEFEMLSWQLWLVQETLRVYKELTPRSNLPN